MALRVGQRVSLGGRSGTVVALRPQGMVDVRFGRGPIERRSAAALRANPDRFQPNDPVRHYDGRLGVVVDKHPPEGYVVHWLPMGPRAVVHSHRIHARNNPTGDRAKDAASEYVTIVAHGIMESSAAKGKEMTLSTAYKIATKRLQQYGYLEPGTRKLTPKGWDQARKKAMEPDAALRRESIEYMLAGGRKAKGYRVVPVGKQFEVRPGGKRFRSEEKARAYAASLGPVDQEGRGEQVRRAAEVARGERKALEKQVKREAKQLQLGLPVSAIAQRDGKFYITGTSKWFGTRAKAEAYLLKGN